MKNLSNWLTWISHVHTKEIDLGLDRISFVAQRLDLLKKNCPIITVGGTNGKGSCVATLESIYHAAGYRVGAFTSPILFKHNEYVRIQKKEASDEKFIRAFEKIESVRENIPLTFFEFNTLAAFLIFREENLDVWLLEVGLGGRLDAVNILDADVSVITSIALDHTDRLGNTREAIGMEKAGIFRSNSLAVCGDENPPHTIIDYAKKINAIFFQRGKDFYFSENASSLREGRSPTKQSSENWNWCTEKKHYENLPHTSLSLQNVSTALMAIELLQNKLPVKEEFIRKGLNEINLPARIQIIPGKITTILDVSHNPAACALLSEKLTQLNCTGKIRAVFSMLSDKDIFESIQTIKKHFHEWHVAPLSIARGASKPLLQENFSRAEIRNIIFYNSIEDAHANAMKNSKPGDCVVVFGSFHTVAKGVNQTGSSVSST